MTPKKKTPALLLLLELLYLSSGVGAEHADVTVETIGESATLICGNDDENSFDHWVLPNTDIIDSSYVNGSRPNVFLTGNRDLYISSVELENLGIYLCYNGGRYNKTDLHLPSLWETYRMNVIIGCSAAGVMLVLFSVGCIVYNLRYERKMEEEDSQILNGYDNGSYSPQKYDLQFDTPSKYDEIVIDNANTRPDDGATKM